ncbi:MAG: DUF962 domain-containing protein [Anaerolineales bacterium]
MITNYINSLKQFWPGYVQAHSKAGTRWLHFIGNTNLFIWLGLSIINRSLFLVGFAVISSYMFAWIGHFFVERNIPITFRYPLKAAICDMVMYYKMWRGEMDAEIKKYLNTTQT